MYADWTRQCAAVCAASEAAHIRAQIERWRLARRSLTVTVRLSSEELFRIGRNGLQEISDETLTMRLDEAQRRALGRIPTR